MARTSNASRSIRDAIIDAAEELWALYGLDGVTLQQITASAGSNNASAVQYHFGGRDGLIEALYRSRVRILEQRRAKLLADNMARSSLLSLQVVLECLFRPFADLRGSNGKRSYAAFQVRLTMAGQGHYRYKYDIDAPVTDFLSKALQEKLAFIPKGEQDRRIALASGIYWQGLIYDDECRNLSEYDNKISSDQLISMMMAILTIGI